MSRNAHFRLWTNPIESKDNEFKEIILKIAQHSIQKY